MIDPIPTALPTTPITLHELYNPKTHKLVAVYSYGHYPAEVFAEAVSKDRKQFGCAHRKQVYADADVIHAHIQEVEEDGETITKQCEPLEFGSAAITLVEL